VLTARCPPIMVANRRCGFEGLVLRLNEPRWKGLGRNVLEEHVAVERTEGWNTVANQDGNEADSDLIDQTGAEKGLHRDPAIDIDVLDTLLGEVFEEPSGLPDATLTFPSRRAGIASGLSVLLRTVNRVSP
jgi:hypothetical protein